MDVGTEVATVEVGSATDDGADDSRAATADSADRRCADVVTGTRDGFGAGAFPLADETGGLTDETDGGATDTAARSSTGGIFRDAFVGQPDVVFGRLASLEGPEAS